MSGARELAYFYLLSEIFGKTRYRIRSVRNGRNDLTKSLGSYIACSIYTFYIGSAVFIGDDISAGITHKPVDHGLYGSYSDCDEDSVNEEVEIFIIFYVSK